MTNPNLYMFINQINIFSNKQKYFSKEEKINLIKNNKTNYCNSNHIKLNTL